jgi:hypothetical protein
VADAVALPQSALDELAVAWSLLDRCRPQQRSGVPAAYRIARRWARSALAIDRLLDNTLSGAYLSLRAEEDGGPQLIALQWVWALLETGHRMSAALAATDGPERLFWELYWRPPEELPSDASRTNGSGSARDEYVRHLASQPLRRPASASTAFLLSMARYWRDNGAQPAVSPAVPAS